MRVAFTIIYNGVHHLKHKDYVKRLLPHVDLWVFVDGLAGNKGSTSWCKELVGCGSEDGTVEYLKELQKTHPNLVLVECEKKWHSKDAMVNRAIEEIKKHTNKSFLWEIDADEQWTPELMSLSEQYLVEKKGKTGTFHSNYFMGQNIRAFGMWGEGVGYPYRRLWDWNGEYFMKHEPPVLLKGNGREVLIPFKFDHYAYYFPQDVEFKSKYYGGHERVYDNWQKMNQGKLKLPCELKILFGHSRGIFPNTTIRAI